MVQKMPSAAKVAQSPNSNHFVEGTVAVLLEDTISSVIFYTKN